MNPRIIDHLPEYFRSGPEQLSSAGFAAGLICWGVLFLVIGLILGAMFLRKASHSVAALEKENLKVFNRLEIYRATVEKQAESSLLSD